MKKITVNAVITKDDIERVDALSNKEYGMYSGLIHNIDKWWWLRSPDNYQNYAAGVYFDGSAHVYGFLVYEESGIRPALYLKSDNLIIGNTYIVKTADNTTVKFTAIDNNILIANDIIGETKFSDIDDNYETSILKECMDNFYEFILTKSEIKNSRKGV